MAETDQCPRVPETMESSRRWSGFVCPDCRFVFRVPRDHDGRVIVCPSCRRMLKIPTASDTPPLLVLSLRSVAAEAAAAKAARQTEQGKKRSKKSRISEEHGWDQAPDKARFRMSDDKRQLFWWLIGGTTLLASIVAVVLVSMLGKNEPKPTTAAQPPATSAPPKVNSPVNDPITDLQRRDAIFLTQAETLAKRFMGATAIDDLLPLVRNPDLAHHRMKNFYPDGQITAPGMSEFNTTKNVLRVGPIIGVMVRTPDLAEKPLYFFETPSGIKIDWESWVGWSGLPWDDFLTKKIPNPTLFRVKISAVQYYNFYFADDQRWQSFRMESPDRKHSIYGYVERNSPLNDKLGKLTGGKPVAITLILRFPANAVSSNQVIIDDYFADGWVFETEPSP